VNEPVFLSRDQVLELHRRSLEEHGGLNGLREPGLFESALMQPEAVYAYAQGDLADIAAAYAFHLAQNQPFLDGNKRTAAASALTFLELNGVGAEHFDGQQLYDAMIAIAERRMDKTGLAAVFRRQFPAA
jgi:death-on-curing protein